MWYTTSWLRSGRSPDSPQTSIVEIPRAEEVTGPAAEPLELYEVKKHLEIASDDITHDSQLNGLIEAARRKWEHDTQHYLMTRTYKVVLESLREFRFPHHPVTAIGSITYYDLDNVQQTLSTDIYQLDTARSQLRRAYSKDWPATLDRWDAATINYTLGSHSASTTVPQIAKAAMKLLVGYYFENRDMLAPDTMQSTAPYERLVLNFMRSSYP